MDPPYAVDHPAWLTLTAWQSGRLVVDRLERTGPGTHRSTRPVPVSGDWKTTLRLAGGGTLAASAVYLPADAAILGAVEVPAPATSTRPLGPETTLLQRERTLDLPGWLWGAASLVVLVCSAALVTALSVGVARLSRSTQDAHAVVVPRQSPRARRASLA